MYKPWYLLLIGLLSYHSQLLGRCTKPLRPLPVQAEPITAWVNGLEKCQYEEAEAILEKQIPAFSGQALAHWYKGLGLLSGRMGKSQQAIRHYRSALLVCEEDSDLYPILCRNIAIRYRKMGGRYLLDSTKVYALLALEFERRREAYSSGFPKTIRVLGDYYKQLGDFDNTQKCYQAKADYYKDLQDTEGLAGAFIDLSGLYANNLRDTEKGIHYAERGLALPGISQEKKIKLTFNLGLAYELKGAHEPDSAAHCYRKAMQLYQQVSDWCHASSGYGELIAMLQSNMGVLLNKQGNYRQALDSLRKAEADNRAYDEMALLANNLDNIGDALVGLGQYDEALAAYNEALEKSFSKFDVGSLWQLPDLEETYAPDKTGTLTTLASKAALLVKIFEESGGLKQKHLEEALRHYDFINQYLDRIRNSFMAEASKFSLAALVKPIFEQAIRAHLLMAEQDETKQEKFQERAFQFAEKTKALVLLESLNAQAAARLSLSPVMLDSLFDLMRKRDWFEKELADHILYQAENDVIRNLRKEVIYYRHEVEQVQDQLLEKNPLYRALIQQEDELVSIDYLQRRVLKRKEAIIEFFLGERSSYAFIITTGTLRVVALDKMGHLRPVIQNTIGGIRGYYENGRDYAASKELFTQHARRLYQLLIAPLGDLPKRLRIIPDEHLLYLPFETLLTEEVVAGTAFRDYPYWIHDKTISYNFSAALLKKMLDHDRIQQPEKLFGAFAPEFPKGHSASDGFEPLPVSTAFVKQLITAVPNSDSFLLSAAGREAFMAEAGKYRILHPVTHTIVDEQNPELSQIRFWDGGVFLKDLYRLNLRAELVVLHSCQTNSGKLYAGEGVASLNRSFINAGAGSVLATLWPLHDKQAPDFMAPFYTQFLLKDYEKDEAVRQSKLLNLDKAPYDWAPFVLFGDLRPIRSESFGLTGIFQLIAGAGLLLLLWGLIRRFRRSRFLQERASIGSSPIRP